MIGSLKNWTTSLGLMSDLILWLLFQYQSLNMSSKSILKDEYFKKNIHTFSLRTLLLDGNLLDEIHPYLCLVVNLQNVTFRDNIIRFPEQTILNQGWAGIKIHLKNILDILNASYDKKGKGWAVCCIEVILHQIILNYNILIVQETNY